MRGVQVQGEVIRSLRAGQGLTQEELAKLADLDVTTLRRMERGDKAFDVKSVAALAQALACHLSRLIVPASAIPEPNSSEQRNVACVARHREGFLHKNVEQVLSCYTEDAVLSYPNSIPSPAAGRFEGHEAIRQHLELAFQTFTSRIPTLEESDVLAFEDRVIVRQVASSVVVHNGVEFTSEILHDFTLRDGKICQHVGFFDTAMMAQALNAPPNTAR